MKIKWPTFYTFFPLPTSIQPPSFQPPPAPKKKETLPYLMLPLRSHFLSFLPKGYLFTFTALHFYRFTRGTRCDSLKRGSSSPPKKAKKWYFLLHILSQCGRKSIFTSISLSALNHLFLVSYQKSIFLYNWTRGKQTIFFARKYPDPRIFLPRRPLLATPP